MDEVEFETKQAELVDRILILSEVVWESRVSKSDIDYWLANYTGESAADGNNRIDAIRIERLNALHLLAQFCFFGQRELRTLLRSMYRDSFQYPIVQALKQELGGSPSLSQVQAAYVERLKATRFLAMGNPSESGSHLLYYFRQENKLHRDLFVHEHELFTGAATDPDTRFAQQGLQQIVFVDDLLGSGQQAEEYSQSFLKDVRQVALRAGTPVKVSYLVLFAKSAGLNRARAIPEGFDEILAVHELDDSQNAFDLNSRVYRGVQSPIDREAGLQLALHYGRMLFPMNPLGYRNGQMLLGLHHNVPDNTLPIFWNNERVKNWATTFVRYPKGEVLWQ